MNDLELTRLYLLYKAGSVQDGRKNSDLLQVAKAAGSDLSQDEFGWLSREVERLGEMRETRAKERNAGAGVSKGVDGAWNAWQTAKKFAMGSSEYQQQLWELPNFLRPSKPFMPTRSADGNPVEPTIRYYHGTTADDASEFAGTTYLSPSENYARNYGTGNKNVLFTDFTKQEAIARGLYDDTNNYPINGSITDGKDRLKPLKLELPPIATPIDPRATARQNAAADASGIVENPLNLPGSSKAFGGGILNMLQTGLDAAGVVDPTPIVDGVNAGISVVRAMTDPRNAGTHLVNAGVSAVSMVPYIGDIAKVFKYGGKAAKAGKVGEEAAQVGSLGGGIGGAIGGLFGGFGGFGGGGGGGDPANPASAGSSGGDSNGNIIGGMAAGAIAVIAAFKALGFWINRTVASGERLLESQRNLAKYSGELTNAFAMFDTRDVLRDVRKAEYLGSSAAGLAGAQSNLKDAVAFRDLPQQRFNNDFGKVLADVATVAVYIQSFMSLWNVGLRIWQGIEDNTKPKDTGENNSIGDLAAAIKEGRFGVDKPPPQKDKLKLPAMDAAQLNRLKGWRW